MNIRTLCLSSLCLFFYGCKPDPTPERNSPVNLEASAPKAESITPKVPLLQCERDEVKQSALLKIQSHLLERILIHNKNVDEQTEDVYRYLKAPEIESAIKQIQFEIYNIRTQNIDPATQKRTCLAQVSYTLPQKMIEQFNLAAEAQHADHFDELAVSEHIKINKNKIYQDLEYTIQLTEDTKKIYLSLNKESSTFDFLDNILFDFLNVNEIKDYYENQELREENANIQRELDAQNEIEEQRKNLETAKKNLNLVWSSTTDEIRTQLEAEQQLWLKRRKLECEIEKNDTAENEQESTLLLCETNKTKARVEELKNKIYQLEEQKPSA